MAALFREVQDVPIKREVIEAVAKQKDFMRRIRSDNGRGTRDILAREGIVLLSGDYDSALIDKLDLTSCLGSEFIAHKIRTTESAKLASKHGFLVDWSKNGQ